MGDIYGDTVVRAFNDESTFKVMQEFASDAVDALGNDEQFKALQFLAKAESSEEVA